MYHLLNAHIETDRRHMLVKNLQAALRCSAFAQLAQHERSAAWPGNRNGGEDWNHGDASAMESMALLFLEHGEAAAEAGKFVRSAVYGFQLRNRHACLHFLNRFLLFRKLHQQSAISDGTPDNVLSEGEPGALPEQRFARAL